MHAFRARLCPRPITQEPHRNLLESLANLAEARHLRGVARGYGEYIEREVERNALREDFERAMWPDRKEA